MITLVMVVSVPLGLLYAVRLGRVLWLAKDAPTEDQP